MFYSTSAHAAKGRIKMPEMKIAVCDDEEFYRNELEKMITVYGNETSRKFTLDAWESGAALLDAVKRGDKDYDVIFLDIEMPELSGMEAAGELRSMGKNMALCFVTSFNDYALNAYQIDAIGYVIKPIQYLDLKKMMEKAEMQYWYRKKTEEAEKRYLEVMCDRRSVIIDLEKVVYIEKRRNQCVFHCTNGEQICYDTLKNISKRLDHDIFMQIHQGYIANYNYVKEVLNDRVCFGSGMEAPLSRRYYNAIHGRYIDKLNRLFAEINTENTIK